MKCSPLPYEKVKNAFLSQYYDTASDSEFKVPSFYKINNLYNEKQKKKIKLVLRTHFASAFESVLRDLNHICARRDGKLKTEDMEKYIDICVKKCTESVPKANEDDISFCRPCKTSIPLLFGLYASQNLPEINSTQAVSCDQGSKASSGQLYKSSQKID